MTIIVDSREKAHIITPILNHFKRSRVTFAISKLVVGDYMSLDNARLVVDRKHDLNELATNLCTGDKTRFWAEVREAKRLGIKIIVLCECGGNYQTIKDVEAWPGKDLTTRDGRTYHISGRDLMEQLYRVHISYGVEFAFCSRPETGGRIMELLRGAV